ncbi:hypothetical protein [Hungatella effluvii]|uniref:hypothetical protein n=1 Tax=Hungatella effluvii TaxID=1096246 RepID=UPI001A9A65C3|nr:hypothetical protein [Hungatella effluvii]
MTYTVFEDERYYICHDGRELREESNANIQNEEGILKRQIRSIQTEGQSAKGMQ